MRKAIMQSHNIIFDLRHIKLSEDKSIAKLEHEFKINTCLKKIYIIKKDWTLLFYKK